MAAEMAPRAHEILRSVITHYILTGEPVGSKTISRMSGEGLSPATIRNVMADLEEMGYLAQPHTSAGRVPTDKGYRYYVDTILPSATPAARDPRGDRSHAEKPRRRADRGDRNRAATAVAADQPGGLPPHAAVVRRGPQAHRVRPPPTRSGCW